MTEAKSPLEVALWYANTKKWFVFPAREKPGKPFVRDGETIIPQEKQPYVAGGLDSATLDGDQIKAWFSMWPHALVAVNCEMSQLFVIDLDTKNGIDGIGNFANLGIETPGALTSRTPSGGLHIVFSGVGPSKSIEALGIDSRGHGGYIIAPPSEILEGKNPGKYVALNDWSKTPGPIPEGLLPKLFPLNTNRVYDNQDYQLEGKGRLSQATKDFIKDGAMPGGRNSALFKAAADLTGCNYTKEECRERLWPISEKIGLGKSEFEDTLNHAFSKKRTPAVPMELQKKVEKKEFTFTASETNVLEEALVACLIMDATLIAPVYDILVADDFLSQKCRYIYKEICKLYNDGLAVDRVTLSSRGVSLEEITTLADNFDLKCENALSYAGIIKELSARRKFQALMRHGEEILNGSSKSFIQVIGEVEKQMADISIYSGARTTSLMTASQAVEQSIERTRKIANGEVKIVPTGFERFDNNEYGLFPDDLLLITGESGSGKSSLALSLANNIALVKKEPVAFFSLEMSVNENICRLVNQLTGIPYKKVMMGKMNETQWAQYRTAMDLIKSSPLYFDDDSSLTIPELRAKIRRLQDKYGISLVVIDQIGLLKGYSNLQRHTQINNLGYDLKAATKDFGLPMAVCHQIRVRASSDGRAKNSDPEMRDLDSAGEQFSTIIWGIKHSRDEMHKIISSKIVTMKNRTGAVDLYFPIKFIPERVLFANAAREDEKAAERVKKEKDDDDDNELPEWAREQ